MRQLLILSSRDLDDEVREAFLRANWAIQLAKSASEAFSLIHEQDFMVGLAIFWPNDAERHTADLRETLSTFRGIRWIAALHKEYMEQDSCVALAAEHLYDFFSLPLDAERLTVILGHAYGMAQVVRRFLNSQRITGRGQFGMVGSSPPMLELYRNIRLAAGSDLPVVISGETGTGKEMVARAIHESSSRAGGPFVALNCASVSASHIQAELYGHEKETFDHSPGKGYIETASGGTLFLDEVAELTLESQASLQRFLEKGTIGPVTDNGQKRIDVRVICSTGVDLDTLVRARSFRHDLYYHINVLPVRIPSLREREADIRSAARYFLEEFLLSNASSAEGFSEAALTMIDRYEWPGNLRELRNRVHQAALYSRGRYLTPADLDLERRSSNRITKSLREAKDAAEKRAIHSALVRNKRNVSETARELRVSRMTLYRLFQKHSIENVR